MMIPVDLAAERAAHLARQWPGLREARAKSIIEELHHRDPHQPGGAPPVTEETIRAAAARRCQGEPPERAQEVAARAVELHESGWRPVARASWKSARSQRSTKGGRPAGGDGAHHPGALPTPPAAPEAPTLPADWKYPGPGEHRSNGGSHEPDNAAHEPEVVIRRRDGVPSRPSDPTAAGENITGNIPSAPKPKREKAKVAAKDENPGTPPKAKGARPTKTARRHLAPREKEQVRDAIRGVLHDQPFATTRRVRALAGPSIPDRLSHEALEMHVGFVRRELGIRWPGNERQSNDAGPGAHAGPDGEPLYEAEGDKVGGVRAARDGNTPAMPTVELGPIWPPLPDAAATDDLLARVLERGAEEAEPAAGTHGGRITMEADGRWRPGCTCGWAGVTYFSKATAESVMRSHVAGRLPGDWLDDSEPQPPEVVHPALPPLDFRPAVTPPAAVTPLPAVNERPAAPPFVPRPRFEARMLEDGTWEIDAVGSAGFIKRMAEVLRIAVACGEVAKPKGRAG